jgi:cell cycle related kinase
VSAKNEVRIADFGLACLYFPKDPKRQYEHQVATRWYRAPELLFGSTRYTPSVDIWAAGCLLAEYLNVDPLFAVFCYFFK